MFEELQKVDTGLRRRPLQRSKLKGPQLTQHFAQNLGMPYKFIATTASSSFDDAPDAIKDALSGLNWDPGLVVKEGHNEFNEVPALGYFEDQSIDYHDDGEHVLGPTIVTLSLDVPARMRLRMKVKYYLGVSKGHGSGDIQGETPGAPPGS